MTEIVIAYLYPAEMNIYGDRGNVITLQQRMSWRGIKSRVDEINLGDDYDFSQADLIFGGGGQDKSQETVAQDLQRHQQQIKKAAKSGVPMLLVCGLYQLFGREFKTGDGQTLPGIGIFGAETLAGPERLIGNVEIETKFGRLVGFENHSGLTRLDDNPAALGRVIKGAGNDGESGQEGAVIHNVVGTYLHGPILPKNPTLADWLISTALSQKGRSATLKPLDDSLELMAAEYARHLPR